MILHQVFDLSDVEGHTHRYADRSHRQQFDRPFHSHRPLGPNSFQGRQPHHLRTVKEQVPWAAFAGIYHELRYGLAQ
jgi:hypothetical protein